VVSVVLVLSGIAILSRASRKAEQLRAEALKPSDTGRARSDKAGMIDLAGYVRS
jgi:hypothetical protein